MELVLCCLEMCDEASDDGDGENGMVVYVE